jgi:hypothetical protein
LQHEDIDQDQTMPIRPYLKSRVFEPEIVEAMGIAFEKARQKLGLARTQDAATETVAKIIIDLADRGDGDAERLYRGVLAHFGVAADEPDFRL